MRTRIAERRRALVVLVCPIGVVVCAVLLGGGSAARAGGSAAVMPVCGPVPVGYARCLSLVVVGGAEPIGPSQPSGYGPADLRSAYQFPSATQGAGQTVALVDAFDDPTAESDLAQYRAFYGMPPCTTANGCFRKVDQIGGTNYPPVKVGWSEEISLDLDMVSAVCPNCNILLVEATTSSYANLFTAEDEAVGLGANEISNSWGGKESTSETNSDVHFNHPGVAITAGTGDSGYGVAYPSTSPYVTAVGGTSLVRKANRRGWKETAWSGSGSGCSGFEPKPAWQTDIGCTRRTVADVSAVADPYTGVAVVYAGTWRVFGGTSVASPIIASAYALAGNASSVNAGSYPYSHTNHLYDIVRGSNGTCSPSYLCRASTGYDGPTGLGTPAGVGAF